MITFSELKQDFKERFLTFETAKGIYLLPFGLILIYTGWYYIQFLLQTVAVLGGVYLASEALRKIFVNRIKQAAKIKDMVSQHVDTVVTVAAPQAVINEVEKAAPETDTVVKKRKRRAVVQKKTRKAATRKR